jgi:hypothetical protein
LLQAKPQAENKQENILSKTGSIMNPAIQQSQPPWHTNLRDGSYLCKDKFNGKKDWWQDTYLLLTITQRLKEMVMIHQWIKRY